MTTGLWVNPETYIQFAPEKKRRMSEEIATRQRSIDYTGLAGYLPNPDPVLKKMGADITVYRELLTDPHVGATAESRASGVKSLLWEIDRDKSKSRAAKFITDMFADIDMYSLISELLDGALYGYQPAEVTWSLGRTKWLPQKIVGKPPEWFQFGTENELLFRSRQNMMGEPVPERKFLIARHRATYANPYGFPNMSRVFWPVTFKKGGLKFWVTFTEKYGMPFPVGKYPPGEKQAEINNLLDMLEKLIADGVAAIPENAMIDFMEHNAGQTSPELYEKLCNFCNQEVSKALLGQTLTTELGSSGSYAASQTHQEVREDIVSADKHMIEQVFNQLIAWVMDYNFSGSSERPHFTLYAEEDVDMALAERDKQLQAGNPRLRFKRSYYTRNYNLQESDFDLAEDSPPAPQQFSPVQRPTQNEAQEAIDQFADFLGDNGLAAENDVLDSIIEPIVQFVNNAESFRGIKNNVSKLYPDLDDAKLSTLIERAVFVSQVWGSITANTNGGR